MAKAVKIVRIKRKPKESEQDPMQKNFDGVVEMFKKDLGENRAGMKEMVEIFSKILSKEAPVPVAKVTVEPANINLPAQNAGARIIKGRVTKRDADGFMEGFELEII